MRSPSCSISSQLRVGRRTSSNQTGREEGERAIAPFSCSSAFPSPSSSFSFSSALTERFAVLSPFALRLLSSVLMSALTVLFVSSFASSIPASVPCVLPLPPPAAVDFSPPFSPSWPWPLWRWALATTQQAGASQIVRDDDSHSRISRRGGVIDEFNLDELLPSSSSSSNSTSSSSSSNDKTLFDPTRLQVACRFRITLVSDNLITALVSHVTLAVLKQTVALDVSRQIGIAMRLVEVDAVQVTSTMLTSSSSSSFVPSCLVLTGRISTDTRISGLIVGLWERGLRVTDLTVRTRQQQQQQGGTVTTTTTTVEYLTPSVWMNQTQYLYRQARQLLLESLAVGGGGGSTSAPPASSSSSLSSLPQAVFSLTTGSNAGTPAFASEVIVTIPKKSVDFLSQCGPAGCVAAVGMGTMFAWAAAVIIGLLVRYFVFGGGKKENDALGEGDGSGNFEREREADNSHAYSMGGGGYPNNTAAAGEEDFSFNNTTTAHHNHHHRFHAPFDFDDRADGEEDGEGDDDGEGYADQSSFDCANRAMGHHSNNNPITAARQQRHGREGEGEERDLSGEGEGGEEKAEAEAEVDAFDEDHHNASSSSAAAAAIQQRRTTPSSASVLAPMMAPLPTFTYTRHSGSVL